MITAAAPDGRRGARLRIAVWHNLPSGGGKRALHDHVRGLLERGHYIEAWCPPTADRDFLPLEPLCKEHVVPLEIVRQSSRVPGLRFFRYYSGLLAPQRAMLEHSRQCAEQIGAGKFDLVFANSSFFPDAVTPLGRFSRSPRILYLQEPFRQLYEVIKGDPWTVPRQGVELLPGRNFRRYLYDLLVAQSFRLRTRDQLTSARAFDEILVNSYFSRESVLRAFGIEATVCYLGIDTSRFRDLHLPREDFVLSVGHLDALKRPETLIEAMALIPEPRPRLVWIANVVPEGYGDDLRELAKARGVEFELLHRVGDKELVDLMNRCLALLYIPRLEPFGFATLEANACGAAVIGVQEGGIRETVIDGQNGLLVLPEPGAIAAAIARLWRTPELARDLGARGRELALEKWSLETAVDRLEGLLIQARDRSTQDRHPTR